MHVKISFEHEGTKIQTELDLASDDSRTLQDLWNTEDAYSGFRDLRIGPDIRAWIHLDRKLWNELVTMKPLVAHVHSMKAVHFPTTGEAEAQNALILIRHAEGASYPDFEP